MPQNNLHLTTLEITHSLTEPEIDAFAKQLEPIAHRAVNHTLSHRARLIKPKVTYDAQAMALSFLPATGRPEDDYTYHHLRRDVYGLCTSAGVEIRSRYVVPSAHLTIGRFVFAEDFGTGEGFDHERMGKMVEVIDEVNEWLEREYWPQGEKGEIKPGGEWVVGEGKGLDHRKGTLWYGGGQTILVGKGF